MAGKYAANLKNTTRQISRKDAKARLKGINLESVAAGNKSAIRPGSTLASFDPVFHLLLGDNAQGKTNILETTSNRHLPLPARLCYI
jgi:hypothetical protein